MEKWICFFDIDGTISYQDKILDTTIKAINTLKEQGHYVVLATGRTPAQLGDILNVIVPDGIIAFNGKYVSWKNEVIFSSPMNKNTMKKLFTDVCAHNGWYVFLSNELIGTCFSHHQLDVFFEELKLHPPAFVDEAYPFTNEIYSVALNVDDMETLQKTYPELSFVRVNDYGYDAFNNDGGKGEACERLCQYLGRSMQQTVAFGDNNNDLSMLMKAQYGIAMGNANPELKALVKHVTKHSLDDGIAWGLKEIVKLI